MISLSSVYPLHLTKQEKWQGVVYAQYDNGYQDLTDKNQVNPQIRCHICQQPLSNRRGIRYQDEQLANLVRIGLYQMRKPVVIAL